MPEWLKRTREALRDDEEFVRLLLRVDEKKCGMKELEEACRASMEAGSVTVAVIEQRILIGRAETAESLPTLEEEECGDLGQYKIKIASAVVYDKLLGLGDDKDGGEPPGPGKDGLAGPSCQEGGQIGWRFQRSYEQD
jgi:hypothetical protein